MAGCITAAACGHTDDAAVTCRYCLEGCARSACQDCAHEGQRAAFLGTAGGEHIFFPEYGRGPFYRCCECGRWECGGCWSLGMLGNNCESCDALTCGSCEGRSRFPACKCAEPLCDSCRAARLLPCMVCGLITCPCVAWPCAGSCGAVCCEACENSATRPPGKAFFCSDSACTGSDSDGCSVFLCSACFHAPDRLRECAHCTRRCACAAHAGGGACSGCSQRMCSECLGACAHCSRAFCEACLLFCDTCSAASCSSCQGSAESPTRQCARCKASVCAACDCSAARSCDACSDCEYFCWDCRPLCINTCPACHGTRCVACSAEEDARAGGGGCSGSGGGACSLCEASLCATCAATHPLTPCLTCPATLCAACIPRHHCSAAKRARTGAVEAAPPP